MTVRTEQNRREQTAVVTTGAESCDLNFDHVVYRSTDAGPPSAVLLLVISRAREALEGLDGGWWYNRRSADTGTIGVQGGGFRRGRRRRGWLDVIDVCSAGVMI
jgi:hypothetical protein